MPTEAKGYSRGARRELVTLETLEKEGAFLHEHRVKEGEEGLRFGDRYMSKAQGVRHIPRNTDHPRQVIAEAGKDILCPSFSAFHHECRMGWWRVGRGWAVCIQGRQGMQS